jgi:hypothetical protein
MMIVDLMSILYCVITSVITSSYNLGLTTVLLLSDF